MGFARSKMGSSDPSGERHDRGSEERRRWSLLGELAQLLSRSGESGSEAAQPADSENVDLEALRRRMMPPERERAQPAAALARRTEQSFVLPHVKAVAAARSMADLPWPGHVADPVWKPVVLPDQEVVPAIPSIDELAEEGGVDAATLRFPIDT